MSRKSSLAFKGRGTGLCRLHVKSQCCCRCCSRQQFDPARQLPVQWRSWRRSPFPRTHRQPALSTAQTPRPVQWCMCVKTNPQPGNDQHSPQCVWFDSWLKARARANPTCTSGAVCMCQHCMVRMHSKTAVQPQTHTRDCNSVWYMYPRHPAMPHLPGQHPSKGGTAGPGWAFCKAILLI